MQDLRSFSTPIAAESTQVPLTDIVREDAPTQVHDLVRHGVVNPWSSEVAPIHGAISFKIELEFDGELPSPFGAPIQGPTVLFVIACEHERVGTVQCFYQSASFSLRTRSAPLTSGCVLHIEMPCYVFESCTLLHLCPAAFTPSPGALTTAPARHLPS